MERCVFEAYAAVKPMPNGDWIAEAHMNGTICTRRMNSRHAAVEWANSRVRSQGRYWEEVRRDINPPVRVYNYRTYVYGARTYLRIVCCQPSMAGYAAVVLRGDNGCLAMFACVGAAFEHPHIAALDRAEEWLRHGK